MLNFFKTKWKLILRTVFFLALVSLLAAGAYYIYWLNFIQVKPKIISGVTLYRQPVTVEVNGQKQNLASFETYSFELTTADEVTVNIMSPAGDTIATRKHSTTIDAGIAVDYFLEDASIQQCMVLADVTPIFYPQPGQPQTIASYSQLSANNSAYYSHASGYINDIYLYPGTYDGKNLPAQISNTQKVLGIYAVDCSMVEDKAKVDEQILWWTHYQPAQQQALYQQKLEELAAQ